MCLDDSVQNDPATRVRVVVTAAVVAWCLSAGGAAGHAVGPIRFDEPEFPAATQIHGLRVATLDGTSIPPLSFRFLIGGRPGDAVISQRGPGLTTYVTDPTIEGSTRGLLVVDFGAEVSSASFAFALSSGYSLGDRLVIVAMAADGTAVASRTAMALEDGVVAGNLAEIAARRTFVALMVSFDTTATRFALDNLSYWPRAVAVADQRLLSAGGERPRAAVDGEGRRVFVWEQQGRVRARLFGRDREPLTDSFSIGAGLGSAEGSPAVSFDRDGRFAVAWTARSTAADGGGAAGGSGVFLQVFESDAVPRTAPIQLAAARAEQVDVTSSDRGDVVVVWASREAIFGRLLSRDGIPKRALDLARPGQAAGTPGQARAAPRVASLGSAGFVVAWEDSALVGPAATGPVSTGPANTGPDNTGSSGGIWVRYFLADGQPRGGAFEVTGSRDGSPAAPAVAVTARGETVVVWQQRRELDFDIWARRIGADGRLLGPELRIHRIAEGDQRAPSVSANAAGGLAIAFESVESGPAGPGVQLFVRTFDPLAKATADELAVGEALPLPAALFADVTLDDRNRLVVAFETRSPGGQPGVVTAALDAEIIAARCVESPTTLCLGGGRFEVAASWADGSGGSGFGRALRLTSDTGTFWFFSRDNLELIVKVLDGSAYNGHFWVFYGALSNVEYSVVVTDTVTGASRRYFNPAGTFASVADVVALPALRTADTASPESPVDPPSRSQALPPWSGGFPEPAVVAAQATCAPTPERLCLEGRFEVEITWSDPSGASGTGWQLPLTRDTGGFWFYGPTNVEVVVKVLDGRAINGHYWVFSGSLSNVRYVLRVTDTVTGATWVRENPQGRLASFGDTLALPGD